MVAPWRRARSIASFANSSFMAQKVLQLCRRLLSHQYLHLLFIRIRKRIFQWPLSVKLCCSSPCCLMENRPKEEGRATGCSHKGEQAGCG